MDKVTALKRLLCAIKNDGTTVDQINGDTIVEIIDQIADQISGGSSGELGELSLTSLPGTSVGTTAISVTGNGDGQLVYAVGGSVEMPNYRDDLSGWTEWDGSSDITAEDGSTIVVAEVDSSKRAISAGMTFINTNLG